MLTPPEITGPIMPDPLPSTGWLPAHDVAQATVYGRAARSAGTLHGYARDWKHFEAYCLTAAAVPMPADPQTVAAYLASIAGRLSVATVRRRAAAISSRHRDAGFTSPTAHRAVELVLAGIARTHGAAPARKAALTMPELRKMLAAMPTDDLRTLRDRALLLVQFAAALRRSELVALDVDDLEFTDEGLILHIRRSKTDQQKKGAQIPIPFFRDPSRCAVRVLKAWLGAACINNGPIFRSFALPRGRSGLTAMQASRLSGHDVARIVKARAAAAGLAPERISGHSLRAGYITTAAQSGAPEASIQHISRHVSTAVLRTYVRRANIFEDTPLARMM